MTTSHSGWSLRLPHVVEAYRLGKYDNTWNRFEVRLDVYRAQKKPDSTKRGIGLFYLYYLYQTGIRNE